MLGFHTWTTFPEKWNKLATFDFEKYELEEGYYFSFFVKTWLIFKLGDPIVKLLYFQTQFNYLKIYNWIIVRWSNIEMKSLKFCLHIFSSVIIFVGRLFVSLCMPIILLRIFTAAWIPRHPAFSTTRHCFRPPKSINSFAITKLCEY